MAVILFYTPFIRRARDVESVMLALRDRGHRVISLTQHTGEFFNAFLKENGIETYTNYLGDEKSISRYLKQLIYFVSFCRRHKVDTVFAHLDPANFVASIGQYFVRAKVYLFRHHINEAALYGYQESITYRITNYLGKNFVVVSKQAKDYMVTQENVPSSRIRHINLAYDFSLFPTADPNTVLRIRQQIRKKLLLVSVCRLTKYKRPEVSIEVVQNLINHGLDVHLFILGAGPMEKELDEIIKARGLSECVQLMGHVQNILEYISAADFVLHPSLLESSCVVVKEAGFLEKPVVVCKGVGDFDEYMINDVNGFVVEPHDFVDQATHILLNNYDQSDKLKQIGSRLREDVVRIFDIEHVIKQYDFVS